ncbi:MAG: sigma-54 interaction domain-containing protein [Thermodesulfobacteriota bacterium]
MNRIKTIIEEIAGTDITVLIKGETGTGKELVAQAIHLNSPRKEKPFIKVNCAAIPATLLESELFGFERGAFTGAHMQKPGKFELANGGTLLLNDIGEIDITLQPKLLQVLQDGEFSRLGGKKDIAVNTRVIATTKDNLERYMQEGKFREDLFFRINVVSITLPPLRERKSQILPLSLFFFNHYCQKFQKSASWISAKTINCFKEYSWPGNIRELENMIKRIILFGEDAAMAGWRENKNNLDDVNHVGSENLLQNGINGLPNYNLKKVKKEAVETAEKGLIKKTLAETHWNRKEAAKLLNISYKALLYKIQKYNLNGWRS